MTTAVDAAAEEIWRLFIDLERWPEMTASMREVRRVDGGPLRVGSEAIVKQPRLPRNHWRVTELEAGHAFTWETAAAGVTTVGGHVVEANGEGAVITLTLRQSGPLAPLVQAVAGGMMRKYLGMEMDGFRRTAEEAARARGR